MTEPRSLSENQRGEIRLTDDVASLSAGGGKPGQGYSAVVIPVEIRGRDGGAIAEMGEPDVANSPRTPGGGSSRQMILIDGTPDEDDVLTCFHATQTPVDSPDAPSLGASAQLGIQHGSTVRRLVPVERERLMGWPTGHTAWGLDENGQRVEMSDTVRDRLTGNGVVTPVASWIADRIRMVAEQS